MAGFFMERGRSMPTQLTEERIAKICLAHFIGFGSNRLRLLKQVCGSYVRAWSATRTVLLTLRLPPQLIESFIEWRAQQVPERIMQHLEKENIRVLLSEDADFPALLRESSDPPEVLYVRGTLSPAPAIAIVGTRKMTSYGEFVVQRFVPELVAHGLTIVSGLALGVDGYAHRMTLEAQGTAIAFLATGIDEASLYPREHVGLAHDILAHGGCLISESPPGTPGLKHLFPLRNRLIASFTLASLIVEAAKGSGSLITAKLALEENREVLSVPGPIWNEQSVGTNQLIALGAKVCTTPQDVLDALAMDRPDLVTQARNDLPITPKDSQFLAHISQPTHVDTLAALANMPVSHVSSQLSCLELKGLVQHLGGQTWVRI